MTSMNPHDKSMPACPKCGSAGEVRLLASGGYDCDDCRHSFRAGATNDNDEPTPARVLHFANDEDEQGLCGAVGYLCENWDYVTCEACLRERECIQSPESERDYRLLRWRDPEGV